MPNLNLLRDLRVKNRIKENYLHSVTDAEKKKEWTNVYGNIKTILQIGKGLRRV